ncbi:ribosomal protein L11 methyltransferase [Prevotellaceae bacterium MN60]|nr:ribosomal protein L11 methyltransferase [Prevotellaceae bacterium MN60]
MKYYELNFTISPCSQDAQDVLSALAGEAGCETFEETTTGLKAYIQQQLFDEDALKLVLDSFPFENTSISYSIQEAEDKDWNEQWEQEGFEPIIVGEGRLIIHDGRHLPQDQSLNFHNSSLPTEIEIDAHLAFGTGTHETTRMICSLLLDMPLKGKRVLDCGCGTGILGICALKLGADSVVGYDIDEWSADNTRHNAVINQVDNNMTALCGDATVLDGFSTEFNLVMANINRNILLNDMERFRSVMTSGASLILSGFYKEDCALLESKAQSLGLSLQATRTDGEWACLLFTCS